MTIIPNGSLKERRFCCACTAQMRGTQNAPWTQELHVVFSLCTSTLPSCPLAFAIQFSRRNFKAVIKEIQSEIKIATFLRFNDYEWKKGSSFVLGVTTKYEYFIAI